jgi:hypothetical protein
MHAHLERAPALALKRRDASGDTTTEAAGEPFDSRRYPG